MFEQSKANSRHLDAAIPIDLPNREKAIRLWPMNGVSKMRGWENDTHHLSPLPIRDSTRMAFDSLGDLESISETVASWALEATTLQRCRLTREIVHVSTLLW